MDWGRVQELLAVRDSDQVMDVLKELQEMAEWNNDKNEKASLLLAQVTCQLLLGMHADAERVLARIRVLAPDNPEVLLNFHQQEVYFALARGDAAGGLRKLNLLLRDHPHIEHEPRYRYLWEEIQRRRAFALVNLGRFREALPLLKQTVSLSSDEPRDLQLSHLYLGTCHYELEQYGSAKEQFMKVIQFGLNNDLQSEARYRLAAILFREGALAHAKLQLEEVIVTFGSPSEPTRHRKGIYELMSKTCHHLGQEECARTYMDLAKGV